MNKKISKAILFSSCTLFAISLFTDCYCTGDGCNTKGVFLLAFGWAGLFTGHAGLAWYANPLLISSWIITFKNSKVAMLMGLTAFFGCLSFLLFDGVVDNEGGVVRKITGYAVGYWCWVSSASVVAIGNLIAMRKAT